MRLIGLLVAVPLVAMSGTAAAQSSANVRLPEPPTAQRTVTVAGAPAPSTRWSPPGPAIRAGVLHPVYGTEADDGITWNGAMFFLAFYLNGIATTLPFGLAGCCTDPAVAAFSLVPFAQWAVGFGGGFAAFIGGGLFAGLEIVAAIIFADGLFHHRPALRPGDVRASREGFAIAF